MHRFEDGIVAPGNGVRTCRYMYDLQLFVLGPYALDREDFVRLWRAAYPNANPVQGFFLTRPQGSNNVTSVLSLLMSYKKLDSPPDNRVCAFCMLDITTHAFYTKTNPALIVSDTLGDALVEWTSVYYPIVACHSELTTADDDILSDLLFVCARLMSIDTLDAHRASVGLADILLKHAVPAKFQAELLISEENSDTFADNPTYRHSEGVRELPSRPPFVSVRGADSGSNHEYVVGHRDSRLPGPSDSAFSSTPHSDYGFGGPKALKETLVHPRLQRIIGDEAINDLTQLFQLSSLTH